MEQLDNHTGLLRRVELRAESEADRDALEQALDRYLRGESRVEPTAQLRPCATTIRSLDGIGLRELGLVVDISSAALQRGGGDLAALQRTLLTAMETCIEEKITPRIDLLDVTRADLDGVVLPLLEQCQELIIKRGRGRLMVRLVDSLGLGLPWSSAPAPRSVPRLVRRTADTFGLSSDRISFMGANDLGLALANSLTAAIYGCGRVATTLGGAGDRAGVTPTELMLIHLMGLYGSSCDLSAVDLLLELLTPLGLRLGQRHPLWGELSLKTSSTGEGDSPEEAPELFAPFNTQHLIGRAPETMRSGSEDTPEGDERVTE